MKRRLGFLIVLLHVIMTGSLPAQTLESELRRESVRQDPANFDALMKIADSLFEVDNAVAIRYAKKARSLALKNADTVQLVYSSRIAGQLENRLGNVDSAIQQFMFILPIAERHRCHDDVKKILNSLASSFGYKDEPGKALEYHFKSLVLREKDGNKQEISITLNNIGTLYLRSSNHEEALLYLTRCLKTKEEIHDSLDLDKLYLNLASCHNGLGNFNDAKALYDRAIAVCEPNCTKIVLASFNHGIGHVYQGQREYTSAKKYFAKALSLSIQDNNSMLQLMNLIGLAEIAFAQKDTLTLNHYLVKIDLFPGKDQFPQELQSYYDLLTKYQVIRGDYKNAYLFQKKNAEIIQILSASKMNQKIIDVQLRFSERENFQKIQAQAELLIAQNASIQKQTIINLLLGGVACLTVVLIFVLFKMNRRKSEINKILDQLVKERTSELERNRLDLQHLYNEQSIVLDKVCRDLVSSLATIQGLNNVAVMENFVNPDVYLRAAERTLFKSIKTIRGNAPSEYSEV